MNEVFQCAGFFSSTQKSLHLQRFMSLLRLLAADHLSWKPGFDSRLDHVGFLEDKVARKQDFLLTIYIITPMLITQS